MVDRYFSDSSEKIKHKSSSIKSKSPLDQLTWNLCENLPLDYEEGSVYSDAFEDLGKVGMEVLLSDKRLFRNTYGEHILENSVWESMGVVCRYVVSTDWKSIIPVEGRQFKQRVNNIGIGWREHFGVGLEGKTWSRLHWISGEIRILKGLENLISIDRAKFLESPEYDAFQDFFRRKLSYFAQYVEDISHAMRDIDRQITDARVAEVAPTKEVVERNVDRLENRGFKVIRQAQDESNQSSSAVNIDLDKKQVVVIEDHPDLIDVVFIGEDKLPVKYISDPKTINEPVFRDSDGRITINTAFPVFSSRRYGELMKKTLVLLLILIEEHEIPSSMLSTFAERIRGEFKDI